MICGSRSSCHRVFLTVFAVAVCVVVASAATAQTRTKSVSRITGKSMNATWTANERRPSKKYRLEMPCTDAATGETAIEAGR